MECTTLPIEDRHTIFIIYKFIIIVQSHFQTNYELILLFIIINRLDIAIRNRRHTGLNIFFR